MSASGSNSSQNTTTSGTSTYTPTNVGALQTGWNAAGGVLGANNGVAETQAGQTSLLNGATAATGANATAIGTDSAFANGAYATNPANANLETYANGSQVNNTNPDYQNMVTQFAQKAQAATDGSFAASGRYGSGADANAYNGAVANESGQLGYQNYAQQQQNQITAADLIAQNNNTSNAQMLAGAGQAAAAGTQALAPGTTLTAAGLAAPAGYASTVATGNGGGTTVGSGTQNTTGSQFGYGVQAGGTNGGGVLGFFGL